MKSKKPVVILVVLFMIAAIVFGGYMLITKVYTLEELRIEGNEVYSDEQISEILTADEYSWSTLYMYFKYKYFNDEVIAFVDTMEPELNDPHTVTMKVYEKAILGYLFIESVGQYAYFDKDGFVVEISSEVIEGVPEVRGLAVERVVLYEQLDLENRGNLADLLLLAGMLKKHDISVRRIDFDTSGMSAYRGDVVISIGSSEYMTEKIMRLEKILPELSGKKGVLHMETWTPQSTDIIFDPD